MKRVLTILTVLVLVGGLGYLGWRKFGPNKNTNNNDPSEGGKYLVIKEWGVKFELPQALQRKASYLLPDRTTDEDNVTFESTEILIPTEFNSEICRPIKVGDTTMMGTTILLFRVPKDSKFNTDRYRWKFEKNLLTTDKFVFHKEFAGLPCTDETSGTLISDLESLSSRLLAL